MPDIEKALDVVAEEAPEDENFDLDAALPSGLWDPEAGKAAGGVNWADLEEGGT